MVYPAETTGGQKYVVAQEPALGSPFEDSDRCRRLAPKKTTRIAKSRSTNPSTTEIFVFIRQLTEPYNLRDYGPSFFRPKITPPP
jgi:hypothetical protein